MCITSSVNAMRSTATNGDKLRCLQKSYLRNKDIAVLMEVGINKASRIKHDFLAKHPTLERVPTDLFVKENHINEERIIRYASMERSVDCSR